MQDRVFVQNPSVGEASPLENRTFMASVVGLPNLTANGITEKEAITSGRLRQRLPPVGYANDSKASSMLSLNMGN
jgi:hypothetical protein